MSKLAGLQPGQVAILNVGKGDTKLSFDPEKPAEREHAAAVITDMLRLGYSVLIQVGERGGKPLYMRADNFDPKTCEYLIVGTPTQSTTEPLVIEKRKGQGRRGRQVNRFPADKTRSVVVAPSAGG